MADNLARIRPVPSVEDDLPTDLHEVPTAEIPAYDTYPGPAAVEELRIRSARDIDVPFRPQPKFKETAEKIGSAAGRAVGAMRELPERVERWKDRLSGAPGGPSGRSVSRQARDLAEKGRLKLEEVRARATVVARGNPLQTIFIVGAAGFVVGMLLRIWRSHRAR